MADRTTRMNEPKTIDCACTKCKKVTPHVFAGKVDLLWRFTCSYCQRDKLLTVMEVRA